MRRGFLGSALLLSLLVTPTTAPRAADANRPATVANFANVPCMITVDRSIDPNLHIEYSVEQDDLDVTAEEVADGRRFQFFAFGTQFTGLPPNWITQADLDRAKLAPASQQESEGWPAGDLLEGNPDWPGSEWLRITPDEDRIPISIAGAQMGADWDTTGAAPGTYVIWAYTWDPAQNAWSPRMGAIRVIDGPDDAIAAPGAYLQPDTGVYMPGGAVDAQACIVAPPGSTYVAEYGVVNGLAEPTWTAFTCDTELESGDVSIPFQVPAGAETGGIHLRVTVTDPDGRSYTAITGRPLEVVGAGDGSPLPDAVRCDTPGPRGCQIAPDRGPAGLGLMLAGLALFRRRR